MNEEEGHWFDYPDIEGVRVKIRPWSKHRSELASDIAYRQLGPTIEATIMAEEMKADWVIEEWEGVFLDVEKKEKAPCESEYKKRLILYNEAFRKFVYGKAEELAKAQP